MQSKPFSREGIPVACPQRTPNQGHEGALFCPLSSRRVSCILGPEVAVLRITSSRLKCACSPPPYMVHAQFSRLEVKPSRQLSSHRKTVWTCGAFGRRPTTEVSVGSWPMGQLLAPIQRDDFASPGCLRASRKSCALTVSAAELPQKAGRLRQPGMSESSPGGRNDLYII